MRQFFRRTPLVRALLVTAATTAGVFACSGDGTSDGNGDDGGVSPDGSLGGDGSVQALIPCVDDTECPSRVCNRTTGLCAEATCEDGVVNGGESDIDCGGSCKKCDDLKKCSGGEDCASGVCKDVGAGLACQPPTNTDGVKNGNETGIDCGSTGNPKCADGQGCATRDDCASDYCKSDVCTPVLPSDGVQNGNETDIDCGGEGSPRCADGKKCLVEGDCQSSVCTGLICQVPSYDDERKNGNETDVDCGGDPAHPCGIGQSCLLGGDCASGGCNYGFKCAAGRSCTQRYGGDTCGTGGDGGRGAANWEDCCLRNPVVPTVGPSAGQTVYLDKYDVTAGRMRVFLEAINYNVRGFVQQARADGKIPLIPNQTPAANKNRRLFEPDWDLYLPVSFAGNTTAPPAEISDCSQFRPLTNSTDCMDNSSPPQPLPRQNGIYTSIRNHLGGLIFKGNDQQSTGCAVGAPGTHAFRFPDGNDPVAPAYDQATYDTKSMQCITYFVAQAFCIWEGGRLELGGEWLAAWGAGAVPWSAETTKTPVRVLSNSYSGCRFPSVGNTGYPCTAIADWDAATKTIEHASYRYSYQWPIMNPPTNADYIVFISAPGRTIGRGPAGHADIVGNNFSITSDMTYNADPQAARHGWDNSGSWEDHDYSKNATGVRTNTGLLNKYGKLGLRCAFTTPN